MITIVRLVSIAALALGALSACTAEQGYTTAQAWQRNQCNRIPDKAEADRCMSKSDMTYDSYKSNR